MNKKLLITCSSCFCIAALAIGAFASQNESLVSESVIMTETAQLQTALDNSNVLRSRYNITSIEEEVALSDSAEVATAALQEDAQMIEKADAQNAIRLYNVDISDGTASLATQLDGDNEMWMLPHEIDGETSFVFMKKGESIESATEKINAVNVSEERKEKMIARARERAGKWYVSCVKKYQSSEEADNFVSSAFVSDLLDSNNIKKVQDIKYVNVSNNDMLAIWVKTAEDEYVIPFAPSSSSDDFVCNDIYTLSAATNHIVK